jgi:predicted dehydrogenase
MSKVQWGVLGAAGIALNRVIPAMRDAPNVTIAALASRDEKRARDAADKAGVEKSYGTYEALLADPSIEAVYIPLPNNLHIEWCLKALEAGKHVLCEKPIAMTAKEAEVLIAARDKAGKLMEEALGIRNHPQWAALRQVLDSGEIGRPRGVHTTLSLNNRDPKNIRNRPETGGGTLYDLGSYTIAGCRMVFNDEPKRVIGLFEMDPDFGIDRLTSAILDFPGGQATILVSMQAGPMTGGSHQNLGVIAERGWIRADFPYAHSVPSTCHLFIGDDKSIGSRHARAIEFPPVNQYRLQGERFSSLIRGENVPAFPIELSIANMRVLDALRRSQQSRTWENV